jgi:hypothetical protein
MRYNINFNKVVQDSGFSGPTSKLAAEIVEHGYASIKDFFNDLTDDELQYYIETYTAFLGDDVTDDRADELLLLAGLMATAEGLDPALDEEDLETIQRRCGMLGQFFIFESLSRKGLIKFYRENISFGEDMMDQPIIEKVAGIDYDSLMGEPDGTD